MKFLLLVITSLTFARSASSITFEADKSALLKFRQAIDPAGNVLSSWDDSTDPCGDAWAGVACHCSSFFDPNLSISVCYPPVNMLDGKERVLQLNLGDPRVTNFYALDGTLPPALGELRELRILDLQDNNFTGELPDISNLWSLEQLRLSNNRLEGIIPVYFRDYPNLRYAWLDNNRFKGSLPEGWCQGSWWLIDVKNNAEVCGEVPLCLRDRLVSYKGTALLDTLRSMNNGGYCGVKPPDCPSETGCGFVGPDPPYWTNITAIAFSFTEFINPHSAMADGPIRYLWAVGNNPQNQTDIIHWLPFDGYTAIKPTLSLNGSAVETTHYYQDYQLQSISLQEGREYYISVLAYNGGGESVGTIITSSPIAVDYTPPELPNGRAVYCGESFLCSPISTDLHSLAVSWDPFVDYQSGVVSYSYQVYEYLPKGGAFHSDTRGYVGRAVTGKIKAKPTEAELRSIFISRLNLHVGNMYFVRVFAVNRAGLEGYMDATPVLIVSTDSPLVYLTSSGRLKGDQAALFATLLFLITALGASGITYWWMKRIQSRQAEAKKKWRSQIRSFEQLMQGLSKEKIDCEDAELEELKQQKELAFVITDLANSTGIAESCPKAFEKVQEMHDTLLRDLIIQHGGYEINTEGDAFHIAFKDVYAASQYCLAVQYQMMEQDWPREILKLSSCKEVRNSIGGELAFRGPRVRMALHWAAEGTMAHRLHTLTRHRIFTGPSFQITRELCESASGGQIVLSHDAWLRLSRDMAAAGHPVLEQLGRYKLDSAPLPLWVYHIASTLGRPLNRKFSGFSLGSLERLEHGRGVAVINPPISPTSKGHLAFVACRLTTTTTTTSSSSSPLNSSSVKEKGGGGGNGGDQDISDAFAAALHYSLASVAQQYGGYIFIRKMSHFGIAFASPIDALRFCHASQALLLRVPWPQDFSHYLGATETLSDGRVLFKGPRLAMAIHYSHDYIVSPFSKGDQGSAQCEYDGAAWELASTVAEVAHGGQVVLSEAAWAAVQDGLPGQPHVISLGTHILNDRILRPQLLTEIMPLLLSKRQFPPPHTKEMSDPGYRDTPDAGTDMALVFARIIKPKEVIEAEQGTPTMMSDNHVIDTLTAHGLALGRAVAAARSLLSDYSGYECKEPEPGKLTLAFRKLEDALAWSCALQESLLHDVDWPEEVYSWAECAPEVDSDSGNVLWRGLRVQVGISWGAPTVKAPLNTGRSDYHGNVVNLAARLMALAQPGQILVDGGKLLSSKDAPLHCQTSGASAVFTHQTVKDRQRQEVVLRQLGMVAIRGMEENHLIHEVSSKALVDRCFAECPALIGPARDTFGSFASRLLSMRHGSHHQHVTKSSFDSTTTTTTTVRAMTQSIQNRSSRVFTSISRSGSLLPRSRLRHESSRISVLDDDDAVGTILDGSGHNPNEFQGRGTTARSSARSSPRYEGPGSARLASASFDVNVIARAPSSPSVVAQEAGAVHPGLTGLLSVELGNNEDENTGPETSLISPGLDFARQVAQMFVERRKQSKK